MAISVTHDAAAVISFTRPDSRYHGRQKREASINCVNPHERMKVPKSTYRLEKGIGCFFDGDDVPKTQRDDRIGAEHEEMVSDMQPPEFIRSSAAIPLRRKSIRTEQIAEKSIMAERDLRVTPPWADPPMRHVCRTGVVASINRHESHDSCRYSTVEREMTWQRAPRACDNLHHP